MKRIPVFEKKFTSTPVYRCNEEYEGNEVYIKRDDLLPFSFGGNKVRKAQKFYHEILEKQPDILVTYGSSSSNHCRIIANLATALGISCLIISPEENNHETPNSKIVRSLGANVKYCALSKVKETIDTTMEELKKNGNPYFIMGGGHGNPGTEGYVEAYGEILEYEKQTGTRFDYIFHASGTGATQAGLISGQLLAGRQEQKIVGISIARMAEPGGNVVLESVLEYLKYLAEKEKITPKELEELCKEAPKRLYFIDRYRLEGYGYYHKPIVETIHQAEKKEGIAMDTTYVGKAFWGMKEYFRENDIKGKKVLFIHTGGTPLYFNEIRE